MGINFGYGGHCGGWILLRQFINQRNKMITNKKSTEFGKQMEYWIISLMLKEGLEIYTPFVDDDAIDLIIKKPNGTFIEIQIKARSKTVVAGDGASFEITYHKKRKNYFFVFYSERLKTFWIMSSEEFLKDSGQNKTGKHIGRRSISFNGKHKDVSFDLSFEASAKKGASLSRRSFLAKGEAKKGGKTGKYTEPLHPRFNKYIATDFSRFK